MYVSSGEENKKTKFTTNAASGFDNPKIQFPPTSVVIWSETDMKYAHGNFFFYRKRDNIHNLVQKPKPVFGYLSLS